MADTSQREKKELSKYGNLVVSYSDGDILIFDHITNLNDIYPRITKQNLIAICSSGNVSLHIGEQDMYAKANDVVFFPSNLKIDKIKCSTDFECKLLCLSDQIIQNMLHEKISVWNHAVYVNKLNIITTSRVCRDEFAHYYALINSKIENYNPVPQEIMHAIIRALVLELCHILEKSLLSVGESVKQSQGKTLFTRFLNLIATNDVKRQPITHYASQLAITPKYLTMLCLKYSNKTASDWIVQYTVEDIRFYLRNSNLSIKQISAKLGFANMSHFGSYVRKYIGVSPSDFRHGR